MSVRATNISAMRAIRDSTLSTSNANTVFVATHDDFYQYAPGSTLTPADGMVYSSADGLGQWIRMYIPSRKWQTQATWSVDESNVTGLASDENTGADDTHPLLTLEELLRRLGRWSATSSVTVRWLSDTTRSTVNLNGISAGGLPAGGTAPSIFFLGVPTVLRSGTLTGATDAPWTVADSSLPTSWSASGLLSTSSGVRMIRKTDGTKHAILGYELVAKTARCSPTTGYSNAASATVGTSAASFTNGDAYEVISLPKFPRIACPPLSAGFNGAYFIYLDAAGFTGGRAQLRLGGFRNFAPISGDIASGSVSVFGGAWIAGGSFSTTGSSSFDRCIVLGSTLQMGPWPGDNNGFSNVIAQAGQIRMSHASFGRLGTLYAYDCSVTALQIDNLATCTLDAMHGSGNTGLIVDIRDSGCSINSASASTAFDATTSLAKPISLVGTTYNYADIPIVNANKGAFFVTN